MPMSDAWKLCKRRAQALLRVLLLLLSCGIGAVNAEGSPTNHKLEFVSLGPHAEIVDTTSCAIAMCPPHFGNQSPRGMGRTPCLQVV